jgi:dTDP-4-dehydrorhamnose reductase
MLLYFCGMQTVLITGANGFVGQYLVPLLSKNYRVIATGKGQSRLVFSHPNYQYLSLDFTDKGAVAEALLQFQPSCIIHSGAMSKPDECELNKERAFETNVQGTINLLEAAKAYKSFFLYLSSDFVFSGENEAYYTEEDEPAPVNYYGETKRLAEEAVKMYSFDWSIVRTVLVYGNPGVGRQNLLTSTAAALQRGEQLKIFNDQLRTPTYVEDLAKGIVSIVDRKANGIFHLSGKDERTPYQMVCEVADHLGLDTSLVEPVTADSFDQPARRPAKTRFDLAKAKKVLGYEAICFEEGLKKTFESLH